MPLFFHYGHAAIVPCSLQSYKCGVFFTIMPSLSKVQRISHKCTIICECVLQFLEVYHRLKHRNPKKNDISSVKMRRLCRIVARLAKSTAISSIFLHFPHIQSQTIRARHISYQKVAHKFTNCVIFIHTMCTCICYCRSLLTLVCFHCVVGTRFVLLNVTSY